MPNAHFDYALGRAVVEILPPQPKKKAPLVGAFFFARYGGGLEPTTFGSLFVRAFGTGE